MSDFNPVAEALFQGCGTNVATLIGVELEQGPVTVEETSDPPEGDLAVLPIACEMGEKSLATLSLACPLADIATLARRTLADEEPDKERELSDDELDAVGEVLNSMSGAVDQVIREHVNEDLHCRPLPWWRTPDPGDNQFEEGEFQLAKGSLSVSGGQTIQLFFRFPPRILEQDAQAKSSKRSERVLLLGFSEELCQSLGSILESARMRVETIDPAADEIEKLCSGADAVMLSGEQDDSFELCRRLRLANETWTVSTVFCMAESTQAQVVRAIESGASHVLRVPTEESTLLRVLDRCWSRSE